MDHARPLLREDIAIFVSEFFNEALEPTNDHFLTLADLILNHIESVMPGHECAGCGDTGAYLHDCSTYTEGDTDDR